MAEKAKKTCGEKDGRSGCINPPSAKRHSCPYQADVNNDDDPKHCRCCENCTHECAMDI